VSFSLAHRLRAEIRAALHEGPATRAQLAKIVGQPSDALAFHIKEMLKDGSIGIAKIEKVGNVNRRYYCVVELPRFSDEQMEAFSREERQAICAIAVQAASTEALASLWAGKMAADPRVFLGWNRIQLDREGRDELADEEAQTWDRRYGIAAEADSRLAESGERGATYITREAASQHPSPCRSMNNLPKKQATVSGLPYSANGGKRQSRQRALRMPSAFHLGTESELKSVRHCTKAQLPPLILPASSESHLTSLTTTSRKCLKKEVLRLPKPKRSATSTRTTIA
jgi:hypothetical protein